MAKSYDLVVFDWDGTVMDTTGLIARGMCLAAKTMGFTEPTLALARSTIGLDWQHAIAKAVPECPPERHAEFNRIYREWYIPNERQVFLFDGMRELIEDLKSEGVLMTVATGKSRIGLDRVLGVTELGRYFVSTQTATECESKPSPDMLERIRIETGIEKERTVMIGDSIFDMVMAGRYGCDAVAMLYGAGLKEDLVQQNPVALCESVSELRTALGMD